MDEEEYGGNSMADLRQFIPRASQISTPPPPYQPPLDHQFYLLNPVHHYHQQPQHLYGMVLMSDSHVTDHMINPPAPTPTSEQFHHSVTATATTDSVNTSATAATPMVVNGNSSDKFDGGSGLGFGEGKDGTVRWPRQETLTLLKIRSRLDYRFKEANQKGPLWDEVSRIMLEEHGYQRSGKKCREKFENLYKYYKKTREGNAGRQDGKHYRFFKQLEAIYGDRTNQNPIPDHYSHHRNNLHYNDTSLIIPNATTGGQFNSTTTHQKLGGGGGGYQSLSLSNSSSDQFDVSSSEDFNNGIENGGSSLDAMMTTPRIKRKRLRCPAEGKRNWEVKMKEFVDSHMRKVMEKQEACLNTIMRTIEQKEQERIFREEEWRKQESERLEREHKFWNDERAWIEARDKALMDALKPVALAKEADEEYNQQYYHHRHSNEELLLMNAHLKPLQPSNKENANGDDDDRKLGGGKDGGIINEEHKWDQQQIMMQVRSSMDRRM